MIAHCIQRKLVSDIKASPYYRIICDGTTNVDGSEQFSINIRFVPEDLIPREYFMGMYICVLILKQ